MSALLEVRDVHTFYGLSHVLHGVSLEAREGQVVAVLGRNGMGKTTLVHTIAGLIPHHQGTVYYDGEAIGNLAPWRIAAKGVGLAPQGHRVFPSLSVAENLEVAQAKPAHEPEWTVDRVRQAFPILDARWRQRAGTLSGGQQQILTIARAMLGSPRLLLMDEPSEGLDPTRSRLVADLIQELRHEGRTVLLVEQRVGFALALADWVYIFSRGAVVFSGTPDQLRQSHEVSQAHLGVGI